mmetsp:Transcript_13747/g.38727  ORF Transcript_13747/g.38727 Transcript_13747/m.38727 type:complete len:258 (-) Transcript_13747:211-984(-)
MYIHMFTLFLLKRSTPSPLLALLFIHAAKVSGFSATFAHEPYIGDPRLLGGRLAHVVHRQRSHGASGEGLHLHPRLASRPGAGCDLDATRALFQRAIHSHLWGSKGGRHQSVYERSKQSALLPRERWDSPDSAPSCGTKGSSQRSSSRPVCLQSAQQRERSPSSSCPMPPFRTHEAQAQPSRLLPRPASCLPSHPRRPYCTPPPRPHESILDEMPCSSLPRPASRSPRRPWDPSAPLPSLLRPSPRASAQRPPQTRH